MKACVLEAIGELTWKEVPDPKPGRGEVLLKIKASGICGSDLDRVYKKGTYRFPTIPGHEFAGEIIEAGADSDPALVGRKAAVFPLLPCRSCDMCEVGAYASCRNYNYFGSRCDGGFAEYISVPVWNLVFGPESLSCEEMAMAEPAAVSLHALSQAGIELGDRIAIFGAGAIGLMLAAFAKAWGASDVILLDIDESKLSFARKIGYPHAINNSSPDWLDKVMEITGGKGVDVAVEGAGVSATAEGCLQAAKPLGKVVFMGNPAGDMHFGQKNYWEILRKQLTIKGTWNSNYTRQKNDWQIALNTMASGKMNVSDFITHRFALEDCNEAFELIRSKKEFANRVMFIPNAES